MDKYVVRKPTWKSLTSAILEKKKSKETELKPSAKKRPLHEKLEQVTANTKIRRRLSLRDEKLLELFTSKPDQPLAVLNEDSGLSNSSGGASQDSLYEVAASGSSCASIAIGNGPRDAATNKNHLRELSDYVHCVPNTQGQHTLLISQTPSVTFNEVLYEDLHHSDSAHRGLTFKSSTTFRSMGSSDPLRHDPAMPTSTTNIGNSQLARIQRDLNSPSATMRLRAIKALRSPTKSAYRNFDVPHEEQNIISEEERRPPPPTSTLTELMKSVVVYVEVRTGEDNRSAGVKKVISALGARVNDKLLRDTTHVVFKDGLLSTYKKAKNWNIPVVSILWIEACKTEGRICDPMKYPISNIDRYENPELYDKMKRHKSMQPDSECNKRVRTKVGTPKEPSTPQTPSETLRKASFLIGDNPSYGTKQTEISKFFARLGQNTNTPKGDGEAVTPAASGAVESPATQLLNRINSNCYTPLSCTRNIKDDAVTTKPVSKLLAKECDAKRTLNFIAEHNAVLPGSPSPKSRKKILVRRRSGLTPKKASNEMIKSSTHRIKSGVAHNKQKTARRRSSMHTTSSEGANKSRPSAGTETMFEDAKTATSTEKTSGGRKHRTPVGRILKRRSTYTNRPVEMSPDDGVAQPKQKAVDRRRTLYTPQSMDVSSNVLFPSLAQSPSSGPHDENALTPSNLKHTSSKLPVAASNGFTTPQTQIGSLLEEHSNTLTFSSTRSASRRRTLFDVSMDIISQRLYNINNSARRSIAPTAELGEETLTAIQDDEGQLAQEKDTIDLTKEGDTSDKNEKQVYDNTSKTPIKAIGTKASKTLKKRKLYVPDEMVLNVATSPPPPRTTASNKRRRTITSDRSLNSTKSTTSTVRKLFKSRKSGPKSSTVCVQPTKATTEKATQEPERREDSSCPQNPCEVETSQTENPLTSQNDPSTYTIEQTEYRWNDINSSEMKLSKVKGTLDITQLNKNTNVDDEEKTLSANSVNVPVGIKNTGPIHQKPKVKDTNVEDEEKTLSANSVNVAIDIKNTGPIHQKPKVKDTNVEDEEKTLSANSVNVAIDIKNTGPIGQKPKVKNTNAKDEEKTLSANSVNVAVDIKNTGPIHQKPKVKNTNVGDEEKPLSANSVNVAIDIKNTGPIGQKPKVAATGQATCAIKDMSKVAVNKNCSELAVQVVETKKLPLLVCTNMHKEQISVVHEAVAKLGGFHVEHYVNEDTTHVVSYEPRRTLNLLRALIRGLWILEFDWVLESLRLGRWANEEPYELKSFSRAVEICRAERQAFGSTYRCELFTDLGPFYVSSRCGPISKEDLRELVELCGGHIVEQRRRAKYILGDSNRSLEDKIYITPFWILDSITQMQVLRFQRYAYPTDSSKPPQQPQATLPTQDQPKAAQSQQSQLVLCSPYSRYSHISARDPANASQFIHY